LADIAAARLNGISKEREVEPQNPLPAARKEYDGTNVHKIERLVSIVGGAALILYGAKRGGLSGAMMAVAGGGLGLRGLSGHCPAYQTLGLSTAKDEELETRGVHVEQGITINASPEELYGFWRNFENLPLITDRLVNVRVTGEKTSSWIATGPAKKPIHWDAEIILDWPNERIAWKSLPGAEIENAGSVRFKPAPYGRGTEVHVTIQYYPPANVLGAGIAMLFGEEPSIQVADMLKRLKRMMETGEIVTTVGQSHGKSLKRVAMNPKS